jgi:uncharacterized membrane protein HdeD (DUF308 family)
MNATANVVNPIRTVARRSFILGIILAILGVLSILVPWASGLAIQAIVGVLMIAAGITWTTFAFQARTWGSGLWEGVTGVLAVIAGVLMLSHPLINLAVLTLILAGYFFATGILKVVFAFKIKGLKGWGWVLFNGITSVILGVLITYQWPVSGLWAIGTLLGVDMLVSGFSLIEIGSSAERLGR